MILLKFNKSVVVSEFVFGFVMKAPSLLGPCNDFASFKKNVALSKKTKFQSPFPFLFIIELNSLHELFQNKLLLLIFL
jgi:hypothetical protein